jgi:hypothetical protein
VPTEEEIVQELAARIKADLKHFSNSMPERYSIAWRGYLAGLFEWNVIELGYYRSLTDLLPQIDEPSPISEIFAGRDDE